MAVKEKAPLPLVPKSIRAVLYARVSSEEQREKQTIQDQRTAAREWSERKGVTIEKVYSDDGVSGMLDLDK
jgi:DNA invertase Pin-like site-specific DNA recombinase